MRRESVLARFGDRFLAIGHHEVGERREEGGVGEDLGIDPFGQRLVPSLGQEGEGDPLLFGDRPLFLSKRALLGCSAHGRVPARPEAGLTKPK